MVSLTWPVTVHSLSKKKEEKKTTAYPCFTISKMGFEGFDYIGLQV